MFKQIKTLKEYKTYKYIVRVPDYKPWLLYVREQYPGKPIVLMINKKNVHEEMDALKEYDIEGYDYMGVIHTLEDYQNIYAT